MSRCLIVDDDRDSREGYAEYLRAFGFDVDESADALSALELLRRRRPDILMVDVLMPGMDGCELMRRIRSTAGLRTIPIIAISACVFASDQARAVAAGCDVFLSKPCLPNDVLAVILKQLKLAKPPANLPGGTSAA